MVAQALLQTAAEPAVTRTEPSPVGCGIGAAGRMIYLIHAAALIRSHQPDWYRSALKKRARKGGAEA